MTFKICVESAYFLRLEFKPVQKKLILKLGRLARRLLKEKPTPPNGESRGRGQKPKGRRPGGFKVP